MKLHVCGASLLTGFIRKISCSLLGRSRDSRALPPPPPRPTYDAGASFRRRSGQSWEKLL
jgi:hypothetical protein